jgi:hypothetical protein
MESVKHVDNGSTNDAPRLGETCEPIRGGNDHETVGLIFMGSMMCHYTIDAMAHGQ